MKNQILENDSITSSSKQIEVLKQHFPACFDKDGNFLPDKIAEIAKAEGADISREGYSLNWLGKSYARLLANLNTETLLAANTKHNNKAENTNSENILIQGDNLDVLKHLKNAYSEQIKMIYIDPPYNTGGDGFVYQDDRKFSADELSKLAGVDDVEAKRILDFTQSKSNSHSAWLTFMFPRLYIAKELLKDDGVIFISIDDNEQSQLKLVCDEVFGEENFLGQIVVLSNPKGRSQDKYFATNHEYIIAYSKSNLEKGALSIAKSKEQLDKDYKEHDEGGKHRTIELRNTHREFGKHNRPNMSFPLYANSEGRVELSEFSGSEKIEPTWADGFEGCWTWDAKKAKKDLHLLVSKLVKAKDGEEARLKVYRKSYASGSQRMMKTFLIDKGVQTEKGQASFNELFGVKEKLFQSPKPIKLIQECVSTSLENDDVVLDFFSGSGTTAHAVMELNAKDGGSRRYMGVQISEASDIKSEAYKAGFKNIFELTRQRVLKAAEKIKSENPEGVCDFGFKEFKTIPVFDGYLNEADTPDQYTIFEGDKLSDEERAQLLLTWQVYDGLPITLDLSKVELGDYSAQQGRHILYLINSGLTLDHIVKMLERIDTEEDFAPQKIVIFEYILSSKAKREITEAIKGYNNRKQIELHLEVRM